ncbi:MAG: carbohydrate porin [Burkholderiales bacterium]
MEKKDRIARPLLLAALLAGAGFDIPAAAEADVEKLNSAVERLLKRVEQLEASNRRLEAALEKEKAAGQKPTPSATKQQAATERATNEKVNDLDDRVGDLENQVVTLKKPSKLEEALEGVTVGAELAMVSQRAQRGATQGNKSQLNYRADVTVEVPLDSFGKLAGVGDSKLFFHLRAGQGEGLTFANPTYTATPNSTAFFLQNSDDSATILGEAWYQFGYPLAPTASGALPRIEGTFGKIDLFGFFDGNEIADNENAAFLNNVFVHSPLLDSGGGIGGDSYGFQPGVIASYKSDVNSVNHWKASLGVFGTAGGAGFQNTFSKPFVIGQLEYGGRVLRNRPGNYRIYAWTNGQFVPYNDDAATTTARQTGFGLSIDQEVISRALTVFARYGHSFSGPVRFDNAITVGAQLNGFSWGRQEDRIGLAYGWLNTSSGFKAAAPAVYGYSPTGAEQDIELYYAWQINKNLQLSPNVQWIVQPGGDPSAQNLWVLGLRAVAGF